MSENKSGDDQEQPAGRQEQIGLSIPREDTEHRSTTRPRRRPGVYEKLQQAAQVDQSLVERWFLPVTVLFLVLIVIGVAIYLAQTSQVDALQREVAALKQQVAGGNPDADVDRLMAEMQALGERLDTVKEWSTEVQSMRGTLGEYGKQLDTLTGRVAALERSPGASGAAASTPSTAASESGAVDTATGDTGWVINLITVADRDAAERFRKRLEDLGVESRIEAVTVEDKSLQRVVVSGFTSRQAAENTGSELKQRLQLSDDPWIARQ